jgi:hypothetical protein
VPQDPLLLCQGRQGLCSGLRCQFLLNVRDVIDMRRVYVLQVATLRVLTVTAPDAQEEDVHEFQPILWPATLNTVSQQSLSAN